jgi:hypothetical protein
LIVSTTPFPFWLAGVLRLVLRLGLLAPPLERDEPLLAREAVLRLRVDAADLERLDFVPVGFARDDFARVDFAAVDFAAADFALVLDPDPLAEVLLRCPLRALDLLLAIRSLTHSLLGSFLCWISVAQQYGAIIQHAGLCKPVC